MATWWCPLEPEGECGGSLRHMWQYSYGECGVAVDNGTRVVVVIMRVTMTVINGGGNNIAGDDDAVQPRCGAHFMHGGMGWICESSSVCSVCERPPRGGMCI